MTTRGSGAAFFVGGPRSGELEVVPNLLEVLEVAVWSLSLFRLIEDSAEGVVPSHIVRYRKAEQLGTNVYAYEVEPDSLPPWW